MPDLQTINQIPPVPPRPLEAHKGTFGTVIVIGGCETMLGAPALCAMAALRSGAGLVKIATIAAALPAALTIEPSATGIILGDDLQTNLHQLDAVDPKHEAILAVGPGLGQSSDMRELIAALLRGRRTIVLDADGLNLLAALLKGKATITAPLILTPHPGEFQRLAAPLGITQSPTDGQARPAAAAALAKALGATVLLKGKATITAPLILTPHPGEFQRLAAPLGITQSPTDGQARPAAAAALAKALGATVLLKGASSIISDGARQFINTTGNPALATAGSGDVLTGLLAALLAQRMPPFEAACLAAHLHGLAADLWANVHGTSGLTARDLSTLLPDAFNHCRPIAHP